MPDIAHLVATKIVSELLFKLQDLTEDPEQNDYIRIIKFGRYTGNLDRDRGYVAVLPGNPEDAKYRTGIIPVDEFASDMGIHFPHREIGPGQWWLINGIASVGMSFNRKRSAGEEEASAIAHSLLARVEKTISETDVSQLEDEQGKKAMLTFVYARDFNESGIDPEIVWKGSSYWAVLVHVPFT